MQIIRNLSINSTQFSQAAFLLLVLYPSVGLLIYVFVNQWDWHYYIPSPKFSSRSIKFRFVILQLNEYIILNEDVFIYECLG